jgi:poly(3-hydroxybutyrate) depolymerase
MIAVSAIVASCRGSPTVPAAPVRSLVVNGVTRTYELHMPPAFQQSVGALVVALHGAGSDGSSFERMTALSNRGDRAGFAVVYPDGLYNPRLGATDWQFFGNDIADDVTFLRQLISTVAVSVQPDPRRIYVAGFSDGGRLAHRAGVELSDLVAGIGVVGGSLDQGAVSGLSVPPVRAPVSVLILQGDADAYCGTALDGSQDQTFDYWTGSPADHCASVDTTMPLCDPQGHPTNLVDKRRSPLQWGHRGQERPFETLIVDSSLSNRCKAYAITQLCATPAASASWSGESHRRLTR